MNWSELKRWEKVAFFAILLMALLTRFYILGARVMSHDESLHTQYSWYLYQGRGYTHNPMMHGPLLFHVTALAYFVLGVSDFAARFFPALFGVALVMTPWLFRRRLGVAGTVVAALLLLISPSISYYSRYIRHDVFNMLPAVILLWSIIRYLERGDSRIFYLFGAAFALLYSTKETAYIYTAIFGGLLALPFLAYLLLSEWEALPKFYPYFVAMLVLVVLFFGVYMLAYRSAEVEVRPLDEAGHASVANAQIPIWGLMAFFGAILSAGGAGVLAFIGFGETALRRMRLFDVLMVLGTLTLPLGSAYILRYVGVDVIALGNAFLVESVAGIPSLDIFISIVVVLVVLGLSAGLGIWWGGVKWLTIAAIHYGIFFTLHTTLFTNALGLLSGPIGALAYWLAQHGVTRGTQPGYYYLIIVALYEYLPALVGIGAGGAAIVYFVRRLLSRSSGAETRAFVTPEQHQEFVEYFFPLFLVGWTLLAWIAYSWAGEKMPWLVVHIALPSIFLSAWGLGRLLAGVDRKALLRRQGWLTLVLLPLALIALTMTLASGFQLISLLRGGVSEAGLSLPQLQVLGQLVGALLAFVALFLLLQWVIRRVGPGQTLRLATLLVVMLLGLVTVRTMSRVNYFNYDLAVEHLVYAHAAPDVKVALDQAREISWRVTGSPTDVRIAYGEDGSWPFSWYMVDFPNAYFYGTTPDPTQLLQSPVVIAGTPQQPAVEAILGNDYLQFDYKYLWWPIEDYKGLGWQRLREIVSTPSMRQALWRIFWDRDYRSYARARADARPLRERVEHVVLNPSLQQAVIQGQWEYDVRPLGRDWEREITLQEWPYRKDFRFYVRRDLAAEVWGYRIGEALPSNAAPVSTPLPDLYGERDAGLPIEASLLLPGSSPRGVAMAADGTFYVADTGQHRIWHMDRQGGVLHTWGQFGTEPGQFQEPWGLAVDERGYVYVADTWNHRVQKFTPQGEFLTAWGTFGEFNVGDPNGQGAFFGPRDIAVGPEGALYVTDTGNKRVQVFDPEGRFLREFGGRGRAPGQLEEPVGVAVSSEGEVYVADFWNQRVQVFSLLGEPLRQWQIGGWDVNNVEEKPFLSLDEAGRVHVSTSSNHRVLVFDAGGSFLWSAGGLSQQGGSLLFPMGVAAGDGVLIVTDAHSSRAVIFGFTE